jgi:hypothetical protein
VVEAVDVVVEAAVVGAVDSVIEVNGLVDRDQIQPPVVHPVIGPAKGMEVQKGKSCHACM